MLGAMTKFTITEIAGLSGLSIPQIEQAISREGVGVKGKGRPRQFEMEDAFTFCVIGAMRRAGIDWRRSIVGSTAFPWPIDKASEIDTDFVLLTPMTNNSYFDISPMAPEDISEHLKSVKSNIGILIDASAIKKRIEAFARKRK
jgi:hypothetical protein